MYIREISTFIGMEVKESFDTVCLKWIVLKHSLQWNMELNNVLIPDFEMLCTV